MKFLQKESCQHFMIYFTSNLCNSINVSIQIFSKAHKSHCDLKDNKNFVPASTTVSTAMVTSFFRRSTISFCDTGFNSNFRRRPMVLNTLCRMELLRDFPTVTSSDIPLLYAAFRNGRLTVRMLPICHELSCELSLSPPEALAKFDCSGEVPNPGKGASG